MYRADGPQHLCRNLPVVTEMGNSTKGWIEFNLEMNLLRFQKLSFAFGFKRIILSSSAVSQRYHVNVATLLKMVQSYCAFANLLD
jgi:hypothetical protein